MTFLPRTLATGALVLSVLLGAAGCGGDEKGPAAEPSSSPTPSATTGTTTTTPPTTSATPRPGLPTDFPNEVPVVEGAVSSKSGGGEEGRKGWTLEVKVAKSVQECFEDATAKLTADGWTERGRTTKPAPQAQLTKPGYAVIISATADGKSRCVLGYQVGQVAP